MKRFTSSAVVCGLILFVGVANVDAKRNRGSKRNNASKKVKRSSEQTPWSQGVSEASQAQALEKFQAGNDLLANARYGEALPIYMNALTQWDHPAIHFNIAVCLINLDRPVEAHDHLEQGMKYGDKPLGTAAFNQGETYGKLLSSSLSRLTIRADQPGVVVTLDGKDLFVGPGSKEVLVKPGAHQLVAKKDPLLPLTKKLEMRGGELQNEDIHLIPLSAAPTKQVRRWKAWVPWAVGGSGAAVVLLGLGVNALAGSDFSKYDAQVAANCEDGCAPDDPRLAGASSTLSRAKVERGIGVGAMAVGASAIVAGVTMFILNQPKTVLETRPQVTPTFTPEGAGISFSMPF